MRCCGEMEKMKEKERCGGKAKLWRFSYVFSYHLQDQIQYLPARLSAFLHKLPRVPGVRKLWGPTLIYLGTC